MNKDAPSPICDPRQDERAFRHCLGQFNTGVTVITAEHEGTKAGVTANSFSSLSLSPPLVLWSIGRESRSLPVFEHAKQFTINILSQDQIPESQCFASKKTDKFEGIDWKYGHNGAPVLNNSAAILECTTEALHDGGDHILIIGRVTHFHDSGRKSLGFARGRYSLAVDHPYMDAQTARKTPESRSEMSSSFGPLLFQAHLASTKGFDAYRMKIGITLEESRVLYVLSEHGPATFDSLLIRTTMPPLEIEDALSTLLKRGEIRKNTLGEIEMTEAGINRRREVNALIVAYENENLKDITPKDLQITKAVLSAYIQKSKRTEKTKTS